MTLSSRARRAVTPALILSAALLLLPQAGLAQGIAFGNGPSDTQAPVEVDADSLSVSQTDGTAIFKGNVLVVQGLTKLSADTVTVVYAQDQSAIQALRADGNVLLVSGEDAAEAKQAEYDIESGVVTMSGDVMVAQGRSTLTSQSMIVNLKTGNAEMQGRVRTVLQPGSE
ncbi:lipopolysaccharide transport periplasmic protein LptA [Pseudooceanicola sp. 502str34]|uniref:lipopolysaccharide transport periplasmic protein LptA n=1 Tax=Maritimibacter alkaliphilus TaxID=404236 RepID=UPI001C93BE84|nr:lipopolysaccharide transport periplasmic protein LptA [Maritimibacter alkaliphilus]MBY6090590.1 lipopolysaccharide transport periplasmic protein LptA [Maritimibacter alkaliphilus]